MGEKNISDFMKMYVSTIGDNLAEIEVFMDELGIKDAVSLEQFEGVFSLAANDLAGRWNEGTKTLRTTMAYGMIPGYPESVLLTSITVDSFVNLIDDVFDEVTTKQERAPFVIEMIRVLSVLNGQGISKETHLGISRYFNKLLCIGVPEMAFTARIKSSRKFGERLGFSIQCYDCKRLDIDFFFELPLLEMGFGEKDTGEMLRLARIFRAVHLIKKDFKDIKHDSENGTETPLVILSEEGSLLGKYMDSLIGHYEKECRAFKPTDFCEELRPVAKRLLDSISDEVEGYRKELGAERSEIR